jgi:membrane associated rhomboid family serine protease
MNSYYKRPGFFGGFSLFPPIIKLLLITNVGIYLLFNFLLAGFIIGDLPFQVIITKYFALNPLKPVSFNGISLSFYPWQLITYMFLHGGFIHLLFNMFALWMFGVELENTWGQKRFLTYYFICGIGAGLCNLLIAPLFGSTGPTIGASGAVYGILVAFGYLFPNRNIYIYGLIPVKAKYLVVLYMLMELFLAGGGASDGIAHFAHLGGGVIGLIYLLIYYRGSSMNFFGNTGFKDKFTSYSSSNKKTYTAPVYSNGANSKKEEVAEAKFHDLPLTDYKKQMEQKNKLEEDRLNELLEKIGESGYESLSENERSELSKLSRR